jgi:thiamine pyrophosphate-dependent acetolactate synthase large subunit-like protein
MNSRADAIARILAAHPNAFFILSNGLTAREAAHFHRSDRCFYLLHAMGEALSIGIGLAMARPTLEIVVIEGDGNALMGLAAWSLMPQPNLTYYVLANGVHETTGGQALPTFPFIPKWCSVLPIATGKTETPNPPPPAEIWQCCQRWLGSP